VAKLKHSILVVDDDPSSRGLLREILQQDGYLVLEADDGELALEFLGRSEIDLVITDRSMPRLGGLELMAKMREQKKKIPVLMLSAYGEEAFWSKAIGLGAVDYLLKPFKAEDVLKIVRKTLTGIKS
jgi:DNA-binding response OmpR family regulator